MNEEPLQLVPIINLGGKQFFIPHYQRGYRWTELQVKQLLDDIDTFEPQPIAGRNENTFYCLQPVAVKLLSEEKKKEFDLEGEWFEVIDGQQRLTTIFLIIQYINQKWKGEDKLAQFSIYYETRTGSQSYLENLKVNADDTVNISKENIDYYYMSVALFTIRKWQLDYEENNNKKFGSARFETKFLESSKLIWYEVTNEKGPDLFERLNVGRIPLTNAELVKALFLSSESFKDVESLSEEEVKVKQFEIAYLWDEIECLLNEEDMKFWSFITNKKRDVYETKIELILDLITGKTENDKDDYFTFIKLFQERNERSLSAVWEEIKKFYYTLVEWYKDKYYYHKIGYLIASRNFGKIKSENSYQSPSLNEMVQFSLANRKDDFNSYINERIKESVKFEPSELTYPNDSAKLFNILLLFNIQTYINHSSLDDYYPFKQHKDNTWSLEHIHARESDNFDKADKIPWLEWLKYHYAILKEFCDEEKNPQKKSELEALTNEIERFNNSDITWVRFEDLFKKVNDYFTPEDEDMDKDRDGLRNLALLSQPNNSALNNSVFEVKRRALITMEKKGDFIPICTKWAFLNYYNDKVSTTPAYFWSRTDRENYYKAIMKLLKEYIPKPSTVIKQSDDE